MITYRILAEDRSAKFDHAHHVTMLNFIRKYYDQRDTIRGPDTILFNRDAEVKGHRFGPRLLLPEDKYLVFESEDGTQQWIFFLPPVLSTEASPMMVLIWSHMSKMRVSPDADDIEFLRDLATRAQRRARPYRRLILTPAQIMEANLTTSEFAKCEFPGPASVQIKYVFNDKINTTEEELSAQSGRHEGDE